MDVKRGFIMEKRRGRCRGAMAIMASVAGSGFASGREIVLFFTQMGLAAWAGVAFAGLVFGLLVSLIAKAAAGTDAGSFPELCHRLMGRRAANLACAMHALLLGMSAVVMLCGAGEAAALALPVEHGFLWGVALAMLVAVAVNAAHRRALPALGFAAVGFGLLLYAGLALDARPVRVYLRGDVHLALSGSLPAALLLALAYGAMNAALCAAPAARWGRREARPAALGATCGIALSALLACANAAVGRGGDALLIQALPTVVLAARWGIVGFWCCVGFGYLCAVSTLTASLGGLIDLIRQERQRRAPVLAALAAAVLLCALLGIPRAVPLAYPAAGWLCAAGMAAALWGNRKPWT